MTDKAKKAKSLTMLFTCFGQGNEAERIAMYVEMLDNIPAEVLDAVCKKTIYECKYLPSVAEILQATKNLVGSVNGTGVKPFNEAWKEIEKEMKDTFVYGEPNFSTPEITEAVKCFGWNELCSVLTKDLPIVRAQLRDIYNMVCEQKKEETVNNHVLGRGALIERTGTDGEIRKLS